MVMLPISDLRHDEQNLMDELVRVWQEKQYRNELRTTYYDTQNTLRDLGISLPPQLRSAEAMLSWPAKAVDSMVTRCQFDGFVMPGEDQDPYGLIPVLADNHWDVEFPQALTSSATHSLCFVSVTKGDVKSGEPDVLVLARSARFGSALWDRRRRGVKAALAIADTDEHSGQPTEVVLYMPDRVVTCVKRHSGWSVDRRRNPIGRVLVTALAFKPDLDRPFGRSRITRAVMQLTDAAVRTVVRSEVGAEFYASPQRYVLGADPDAFEGTNARWDAVTTRMLGLSKDEDGDVPSVGQFQQLTMQPHADQLRMLAGLFSGETGLPMADLGIIHDQPPSAESIFAAKESLVMQCNAANRVWGAGLRVIAGQIVCVRDGLTEVPDDLKNIQARWRNPATPSVVTASDAFVKQVSAIPWLAESEVALEFLGYDEATRTRLLSDKRRFDARQAMGNLTSLAAADVATTAPVEPPAEGDVSAAGG